MAYEIIIAYILTIGVPALILAIGSMVDSMEVNSILAYGSFVSFMSYYIYKEILPAWILSLMIIVLGLFFVVLYMNLFGGSDD